MCLRAWRQCSINFTRRSGVWDPHSPGDAYTGRGRRLPPGRRQHEDGRPLDPVVQGGGDARIRRVMVARAPPRADFRGECGADVAGTAGSHWKTRIGASTPGRRTGVPGESRVVCGGFGKFEQTWTSRAVSPSTRIAKVSPATSVVERRDVTEPCPLHRDRSERRRREELELQSRFQIGGRGGLRPGSTKLKEKEGLDNGHHRLRALEEMEPARAKIGTSARAWRVRNTTTDSECAGCLGGWSEATIMDLW